MIIFLFYNANLIDIINEDGTGLAYVDDTIMVIEGRDFKSTHDKIKYIMEKEGGCMQWSQDHNSQFKSSKSVIIDCSRTRVTDSTTRKKILTPQPDITIGGLTIKPSRSSKYLGVIIDQELRWNEQAAAAVAKGAKWTAAIK